MFWKRIALAALASIAVYAQFPDFTPPTPLFRAATKNDLDEVKRLLREGADPNEGRFVGMTPVFFAIINRNPEMLRTMVAKGADVRATDGFGSTTLMWAAANEEAETEMVQALIKFGVDPSAGNKSGDTALTWAMRRGHTPVVELLTKSGANANNRVQDSVKRALGLLQKTGPQFIRVSGCTSCHNQSVPQMAVGLARERGVSVDDGNWKNQAQAVVAMFSSVRAEMQKGTDRIPDPTISVSYSLVGLHADGYAPDETTAAMAHLISTKQSADGSFPAIPAARPPMESSDFTGTALSLRALQAYGKNPEPAVARAREWLRSHTPKTSEDRAMQLMGLAWAKADAADLQKATQAILAEQRPDGGWGQLPALETDAYATGQALYALYQAGQVATSHPAYQRAMGFLLRTQFPDGSWLVRSRSFPFQPYKESGFPHGKDQWISAAGTGWAAMALAATIEPLRRLDTEGQ
jgi:hypothetical protein